MNRLAFMHRVHRSSELLLHVRRPAVSWKLVHRMSYGLLVLAAGAVLAACDSDDGFAPIVELPRQLTVAEQAVIRHANAFGFDLFKRVHAAEQSPNLFLSPFSASMVL